MAGVTLIPVTGIGEVRPGDDVAVLIIEALGPAGLEDSDVVVVTHKIVSKAEGRVVEVVDDAGYRRLVEAEAVEVIRRRGQLIITRTAHGFICANSGVDRSNAGPGRAVLLPLDPDRSAQRIRVRLERAFGVALAVVITDTFGRPWRRGLVDVAIGVAGMAAITDLRGENDSAGRPLEVTEVATADEVAAAADLVMGKAAGIPVAVVRGVEYRYGDEGIAPVIRPASEDLFR